DFRRAIFIDACLSIGDFITGDNRLTLKQYWRTIECFKGERFSASRRNTAHIVFSTFSDHTELKVGRTTKDTFCLSGILYARELNDNTASTLGLYQSFGHPKLSNTIA